ncbi:MAG: hypothetical protein JWP94_1964 [Mucilaginibacter sp.]|nr:hypothetical protein [Mucilaginibacter sp.]
MVYRLRRGIGGYVLLVGRVGGWKIRKKPPRHCEERSNLYTCQSLEQNVKLEQKAACADLRPAKFPYIHLSL